MPGRVQQLTPARQAVLEAPYIYNRPLIEADSVTVTRQTRVSPDCTIRP